MNASTAPFRMLIGGHLVAGSVSMPVTDPATEQAFANAPDCTDDELETAIAAARAAFPGWRQAGIEHRRALVRQMALRIEVHVADLSRLLTQEQGKTLAASGREFDSMSRFMRGLAKLDLPETVNEDTPERRSVTRRVPVGVVAALSP